MSVLATLGAAAINNVMSEWHASRAQDRAKELMDKQNAMNQANALTAYSNQVQGMRMAGLNPAMSQSLGNAPVQSVSQGTGAKGENVELSPQDLLVSAQARNLDAQTEKVKEESQQVKNINDQTDSANRAAQSMYIDNIDREVADLTDQASNLDANSPKYEEIMDRIDRLNADKERVADPKFRGALGIAQGLKSGAEASKANFDAVNNFLQGRLDKNVLLKKNMDPGVVDALAKMPKLAKAQLSRSIDKLGVEIEAIKKSKELTGEQIEKVKKEVEKIGNDILHANLQDPVFIRTQLGADSKEWKAWTDQDWRNNAWKVAESIIPALLGFAVGGKVAGTAAGTAVQKANQSKAAGASILDPYKDIAQDPKDPHGIHRMFRNFYGNH